MVINNTKSDFKSAEVLIQYPIIAPMIKHPIRLTLKVDHGNSAFELDMYFPTKYLNPLPIPPPKKTKMNCFKIYFLFD